MPAYPGVLISEWTEVLTTHLNGYIQATNRNTPMIGPLLLPPPWSLPPWWPGSLTATVSVQSILGQGLKTRSSKTDGDLI